MSSLEMLSKDKQAFVDIIEEIASNNSGGAISKYAPRYFTIDWSKASENWKYVLTNTTINEINTIHFAIGSSYKRFIQNINSYIITAYPFSEIYQDNSNSFSYIPLYVSEMVLTQVGIDAKPRIQSFEDIINTMNKILPLMLGEQINLSMEGITEITEEEFYNFD